MRRITKAVPFPLGPTGKFKAESLDACVLLRPAHPRHNADSHAVEVSNNGCSLRNSALWISGEPEEEGRRDSRTPPTTQLKRY